MAMADWSSLPADLVNRIADSFLATNDLDFYTDVRAVCSNWRSAIADPKNNPGDPRFHPVQWAMLTLSKSDDTRRLFLNVSTGRFLHKDLPLLRNYYLITTTGGLLIVAERDSPHAVRVLNPFTASSIRFMAPVPSEMELKATLVGTSPTLVLVSSYSKVYSAVPNSERFRVEEYGNGIYDDDHSRSELTSIMCNLCKADGQASVMTAAEASRMFDVTTNMIIPLFPPPGFLPLTYRVESAGENLFIFRRPLGMEVFKVDLATEVLEPIRCIAGRALFLGRRCLSVDADKLPAIQRNCIYYTVGTSRFQTICRYHLTDEIEERITGYKNRRMPRDGTLLVDDDNDTCYDNLPSFTLVQILSNYCADIPQSELACEEMWQMFRSLYFS